MFKVGDWVRSKDGIDICMVANDTVRFYKECFNEDLADEWEIWQPQEGEWCWFYNYNVDIPNFLIFTGLSEDSLYYGAYCVGGCDIEFDYCEPFIGELPSFIKESK